MARTKKDRWVAVLCAAVVLGGWNASPVAARIKVPYTVTTRLSIAPGIVHERGTIFTNWGGTQRVQVGRVKIRRADVHVRSLLSNDTVVGLEPTSVIAAEHSSRDHRSMLAVNGDVSRLGFSGPEAAPHSLHISGGEVLVSQECAKPTLGIEADGRTRSGMVRLRMRADLGSRTRRHRRILHLAGINTPRVQDEIILYTPRFGASTMTSPGGAEVILDTVGRVEVSGAVPAVVRHITAWGGDSRLRAGQMVLSGRGLGAQRLRTLRTGDRMQLTFRMLKADPDRPCARGATTTSSWDHVVETIGGNHWLALDGRPAAPSTDEYPAGALLAPRTSVGVTADGTVLMVTVDGRQRNWSKGVTLAEMAALMVSLGARMAINLDGGGSTVMVVRLPGTDELTVTTRPCGHGGAERWVSQALVAFSLPSSG